ncbi:MAG TPA: 7-carboxy-7-deazaguanine synthase QueE [Thermoleophilia bacterium]|nr:7-carboxy-7-deazaguanine synthase QueE [Thermoleophilia bacterium]
MTFVRLAGCNAPDLRLGCVVWCDTPESWDASAGEEMEAGSIAEHVGLPRLCLTGGEPLLQVDGVPELVEEAHLRGIRVHLETNGTMDGICDFEWVTVSPKPPGYMIAKSWDGRIDELKFVVDEAVDADAVERLAAAHPGAIVCVQPEYGKGPAGAAARGAVEKTIALVMGHPEWRLSLQIHKYLGIR